MPADLADHPMVYGFRINGEMVVEPGDDPTVIERYRRCFTCEQWSPCDVRVKVGA